ncbi:TRAP transporter large permease subunit [Thalassotalea sp. M1531]|uniref:TRAP transporter large permease protein n=1 Tax=Thalassotalea algicola TaxID=2716224 RepID=A0A7Y0LD13_9GAMM|nr:TRAP transporter large permease subunit [Thalassotalea algicola]NMP32186.1 TRAP transporter large permease subunit [Thalassotalea algicola]
MEFIPLLMFITVCLVLLIGYPVAFTLAGVALIFAGVGVATGTFEPLFLSALPSRLYGVINNQTLLAVPLFVFMGAMLERSKIAENLLNAMSLLMGRFHGGLGIAVTLVGMLLAASTGIVGATVVTMGLLSLPTMIKRGYDPKFSTGIICATGTLGQIIPPSIALVLLGDVLSSAYQQAQLKMGIFSPETVSVGELFAGAVIPGLMLVAFYMLYCIAVAIFKPQSVPKVLRDDIEGIDSDVSIGALIFGALIPPMLLIVAVLGSILFGFATPTEAAGVGAMGALILALSQGQLTRTNLSAVTQSTVKITSMVFLILIGASLFSLVFRGFGGEELVHGFFEQMPGGVLGATLIVMLVIFLLGFILDFIEITFVVIPIVAPVLLMMGLDPIWLGIMIAINLQTSFLTPPFGFALFYLRGVANKVVKTSDIYKGVIPFIGMQLLLLVALALWPRLVTWLPEIMYG